MNIHEKISTSERVYLDSGHKKTISLIINDPDLSVTIWDLNSVQEFGSGTITSFPVDFSAAPGETIVEQWVLNYPRVSAYIWHYKETLSQI